MAARHPEQKQKAYGILNNINQAFVDLVRKSGGLNAKRHLLIAGYATDIDLTVDPDFVMPKDPVNHCIVSVHYYTPYTFAGLEKDESWGKMRTTWGTDQRILPNWTPTWRKTKTPFPGPGRSGYRGGIWRDPEEQGSRERPPLHFGGGREGLRDGDVPDAVGPGLALQPADP